METMNWYSLKEAVTKTAIAVNYFGNEIIWEDRAGRKSRIFSAENVAEFVKRPLPANHADPKFDVRLFVCAEKRYL